MGQAERRSEKVQKDCSIILRHACSEKGRAQPKAVPAPGPCCTALTYNLSTTLIERANLHCVVVAAGRNLDNSKDTWKETNISRKIHQEYNEEEIGTGEEGLRV